MFSPDFTIVYLMARLRKQGHKTEIEWTGPLPYLSMDKNRK